MIDATAVAVKEALFALLHPIFRECCDGDSIPYDLSTPFVDGEWVYATDRRIIARCQVTPEIAIAIAALPVIRDKKRVKDPGSVYETSDFESEPMDLSPVSSLSVCSLCQGTGEQSPCECSACDHLGIDEKCGRCLGRGFGEGFAEGIILGESRIAHYFASLLSSHEATLYAPLDNPNGMKAVKFTIAPDIEGRVMPMSRPVA